MSLLGVQFGTKHSYYDWGLILQSRSNEYPEPKEKLIDIGGRNGSLDLSTALTGYIQYYDRKIKYDFALPITRTGQIVLMREISSAIHGQKVVIIDDEDPDYYYLGRCKITVNDVKQNIRYFSVECTCEPYKYKIDSSRSILYLSNKNLVNINDHQWFRFLTGLGTISDTGWYYINNTGKEYSRNFYGVGYPTPVAPGTRLYARNDLNSSISALNTVYIAEYDRYMNFIKKSAEITSGILDYTVCDNCYYVICGFGMRAGNDNKSKPYMGIWSNSNGYADYDATVVDSSFSFTVEGYKEIIPEFVVYGSVTLTYEERTYTLSSGTHRILSLILHSGENNIAVSGHGCVSATYQEVAL